MLKLHKITKDYPAGGGFVHALRGVDLKFQKSEFVSILGPSGCGKTTLLNIIGGLDKYTNGDLIINGKTTKDFNDRDWDTYRNHSIGFVFQSYNLIPHQTVLQNVEIALTVSGAKKKERRQRAIEALEKVGLGDQLNKRPNQISGGQMQRVAIARALVNDPDIILADEPTGALDTETSTQVMEILKKISEDRLVIMVTHNPNLANKYSTRIIRMLDGKITSDSAPPKDAPAKEAGDLTKSVDKKCAGKKPSMSFLTAFMLSLKNLFTKKGRTALTAFAGSIGIMGIALILAVSQGTSRYINDVQEDALSSYPLTIEKTSVDLNTLMSTFMNVRKEEIKHEKDAVYKKTAIYDMVTALNDLEKNENDLRSFKTFLDKEYYNENSPRGLSEALTGVQYGYDLDLLVYTKNDAGEILKSDTRELLQNLMLRQMKRTVTSPESIDPAVFSELSAGNPFMSRMQPSLWQEMLAGKDDAVVNDLLKKQYDLVYGSWPENHNEILLVLDRNNELDDLTLYALGLEPKEKVEAIMNAAINRTELPKSDSKWSYEEISEREFKVILNSNCYNLDEKTGLYTDLRKTEAGLRYLYDNALSLKVTGIIRPNEDAQSRMLTGSIAYTKALTEYVIEHSKDAPVVKAQIENPTTDILNGLPFKSGEGELTPKEKEEILRDHLLGMDEQGKAEIYIGIMSIPPKEQVDAMVERTLASFTRQDIEDAMAGALAKSMGLDEEAVLAYLSSMDDEEILSIFETSMAEQFKSQYAENVRLQSKTMIPAQLAFMLDQSLDTFSPEKWELYYDTLMDFSGSTYEQNLARIGFVDLDSPQTINIFASSFENKAIIEDAIAEYNQNVPELSQIKYTDYLGIMMSSITTIINAITYVLLAFVAISLIVSSIMIGVITLISVQERTKEIGILRAIGASKGDVASLFNAETVIVGFASGLLGVLVTYLLCIPINIIAYRVTKIANLRAFLPLNAAIILVLISVGLSLIAGFIPSRSAAKKDPVVALRTE